MKRKLSAPAKRAAKTQKAPMVTKAIDLSDMPETIFSRKARRGLFYRPRKASITIRIDQDVLDYYKAHAADGRYQTEINSVLRQHMGDRSL